MALLLGGCVGRLPPPELPDLDGLEPPVAQRLRERHAAVLAAPTAESFSAYARALHAHGFDARAERTYLAAAGLVSGAAAFPHLHLAGAAAMEIAPDRAAEHFTRARSLRSDYPATDLMLGRVLEALGRHEEARACFERALAARFAVSHSRLGLGRVALAAGDPEAALHHLEHARRCEPDHEEVHAALARGYAQLGRAEESRAAARRAGDLEQPTAFRDELQLEVGQENVGSEARLHRGAALARAGRAAEALAELRGVLAVRPDCVEAHDYLALLLHETDPLQARPHVDAILTLQPSNPRALELRARVLLATGQRAAAHHDLRKLLRVDPDHAWAKQQLGR